MWSWSKIPSLLSLNWTIIKNNLTLLSKNKSTLTKNRKLCAKLITFYRSVRIKFMIQNKFSNQTKRDNCFIKVKTVVKMWYRSLKVNLQRIKNKVGTIWRNLASCNCRMILIKLACFMVQIAPRTLDQLQSKNCLFL